MISLFQRFEKSRKIQVKVCIALVVKVLVKIVGDLVKLIQLKLHCGLDLCEEVTRKNFNSPLYDRDSN